ncbi:MAG: hypothetical protein GX620_10745 [Chloroflexi bacterium]|nr:hypothetical protein [Chloroflexota bacterium]
MRLTQHPECARYIGAGALVAQAKRSISAWRASGKPFTAGSHLPCWHVGDAEALVKSLADMFGEYNRVMWECFPYCRHCDGGCCVPDASRVGRFDAIALALLDISLPDLSEDIAASERRCIYHTPTGCTWPAGWHNIKCWSFYCLGDLSASVDGGSNQGSSIWERQAALTHELAHVVQSSLPDVLRDHERASDDALVAHLSDPVDFAQALDRALDEVFVQPFVAWYPLDGVLEADERTALAQESAIWTGRDASVEGDWIGALLELADAGVAVVASGSSSSCDVRCAVRDGIMEFVAGLMTELDEVDIGEGSSGFGISLDQLLADLEALEWSVQGFPGNGAQQLAVVYGHYVTVSPPAAGERPALGYRMGQQVRNLWRYWDRLVAAV